MRLAMAYQEYEMSQQQYDRLMNAIHATPNLPVMRIGGKWTGNEKLDRANRAWDELGDEMGFEGHTARPHGPDPKRFAAIPKARPLYTKSSEPTESERTWPIPVQEDAPKPQFYSGDEPIDLPPLKSGGGGDFAGAGASGEWTASPPPPAPSPSPSYSDSSYSSDSGSSGSDSGSSSSSSD